MRGLPLLIQLAQRATDEQCSELGRVAAEREAAEAARASHEAGMEREMELATTDPVAMMALASWRTHAARVRSGLAAQEAQTARREDDARDALRSAFVDLKRLEMAQDAAARAARMAAMRRADLRAEEQAGALRTR